MIRPRYSQADQQPELTMATVERLIRAAVRSEREWRYARAIGDGSHGVGAPSFSLLAGVVTTAISQASGTSWGSGNAQFYYQDADPDGSSSSLSADPDFTSVVVRNWYTTSGTVAVGKHCWCAAYSGAMWLMVWEC
jgi:hypothetical protein